jgi:hypothetical protein
MYLEDERHLSFLFRRMSDKKPIGPKEKEESLIS